MDIEPLTIKIDRAEDLLAYLPYRFGYVPTRSLAVLTVLAPAPGHVEIGLAARLDLADLTVPGVLEQAAAGLVRQMMLDPTIAVQTVVYTDEPIEHVRAGQGEAGAVVQEWLETMPLTDPTATFVVTPEVYACLDCQDVPCCPSGGHPVSRLATSPVAVRMVLEGNTLASGRGELGCPRQIAPERLARATRSADRERQAMRTRAAPAQQRWRRRMMDAFGLALAEADDPGGRWQPDPDVLGRLGVAMDDPYLRDALVAWTVSGERGLPGSTDVLDRFGGMLTGELRLPDRRHLEAAQRVLTEVVRHAAPGRAGYALAMLGWVAWWCGEGARADVLAEQCLDEDPGCRLGLMLVDVVRDGVRPGWALPRSCVTPAHR